MNKEKLNKDESIIQLLEHLGNRFGFDKFIINDFWDADLRAIGLSDHQKETLIYISTYCKKEGQYYISIEEMDNPIISIDQSESIEIKELEVKIAKHLKLK